MSATTAAERLLRCGSIDLGIDDALFNAAEARCHLRPFELTSGSPGFRVERSSALGDRGTPLEGSNAPWGSYSLEGDVLHAHLPDGDMWAAESVLRIAWQVLTSRQGGVLMHGCGLVFGDRAVAAIGQSGAGKSTLAALSSGHPGHARLLTDEIVQLFPDTCSVWGTPFRSNPENVGGPGGGVRLSALLLLEKGSHEAMTRVPPGAAVPELLGQLYRAAAAEVVQGELVRRVLRLVDSVGVYRLTFRKDAAVGAFLRAWVQGHGH